MTKIYFLEGKRIDLDSSEWNRIYYDGTWNSRGINLFWRKKDNCFILETWSNWQNEFNKVEVLIKHEAVEFLLGEEQHPQRVNDAFQIIKFKPEEL